MMRKNYAFVSNFAPKVQSYIRAQPGRMRARTFSLGVFVKAVVKAFVIVAGLGLAQVAAADVQTLQGEGQNDVAACTAAKYSGQEMLRRINSQTIEAKYDVQSYGQCQCEPPLPSGKRWCSIDMYYSKTN